MHLLLHVFLTNGIMDQLRQFAHSTLIHAEARHFRHTDTQAGGITWVSIARNQIVVYDDVVGLQALGNLNASTPLGDIHSDCVALRVAKLTRLNRGAKFIEATTERLRVAHDLCSILAAILLHLACGNDQRGQSVQVMVTRGAGEDPSISGWPVFFLALCIQVAENYAALWTWEGFVGAPRHPCRPLAQWILKLTSCDQPQHMCPIIKQW